MKRFLDASVLVEACLSQSSRFLRADELVNDRSSITSAHALAESYATLSGDRRLRITPADAARMINDLADIVALFAFEAKEYRTLIASAPAQGIRGGAIYDALHAETARRAGCEEIHTLNVSHFRHVAPDLRIVSL
jgi:predicted nucleic acid-binding protein